MRVVRLCAFAAVAAAVANAQCTFDPVIRPDPTACSGTEPVYPGSGCEKLYDMNRPTVSDLNTAFPEGQRAGSVGNSNIEWAINDDSVTFTDLTLTYPTGFSFNHVCYQQRLYAPGHTADKMGAFDVHIGDTVQATPAASITIPDPLNNDLNCYDLGSNFDVTSQVTFRFYLAGGGFGAGDPGGANLILVSDNCGTTTTTTTTLPPTTTTTTTTTAAPTPACDCDAEKLEVVYTSDAIPDATADAISNISLDTDTWEVVFEVRNVRAIKNGHVIAAPVNTQETAANAFTPLVDNFQAGDLWAPLSCGLGGIDTPAANLKVRTEWDNAACRTKYEMRYSLISTENRDDTYCDLTDDNAGNIKVNCSIVLSSVRAYASTELTAFTAQEAAFAAELNLGTYLNNEVTDLLHATMAKCSVKNGPLYVVDCRVPGVWNFDQGAFSVVQEPAGWINGASCASNVVGSDAATAATFIRCNIENDAPIANVQRALANITGTPLGNPSNALTFDVDFIVPRKVTTTASASLASFVQTIEMKDGKYYYGTADVATLEITVVDTARLAMTALELFNSATPTKQVYDIFPGTSDARFQTALNADATKFTIDFYPAAIREDSAFYRFGPHGINVSFTFSAARRVTGGGTGGAGNVLVEGLNVEGTEVTTSSTAHGSAASSSSGTALMAGVAVGAAVLVAGLVGAGVVAYKRRSAAAEQKEQL